MRKILNPVRDYKGKKKAQREQIFNGVKIILLVSVFILIGSFVIYPSHHFLKKREHFERR